MRFFKEPLLHFLVFGAALFFLYAWVNPTGFSSDHQIVIDEGKIKSLEEKFTKTWRRSPTAEEVNVLIDNYALEEIYYREALLMGLDKHDPIIRRRLRQKMEFFLGSMAFNAAPSNGELKAYFEKYKDTYKAEDKYSFQQIYVQANASEKVLAEKLAQIKQQIASEKIPSGDVSLLPNNYVMISARQVDGNFGKGFAKKIQKLTVGEWSEPVISSLGYHFVLLNEYVPSGAPEFATVKMQVERDWLFEKKQQGQKATNQRLLSEYQIILPGDK